MAAGARYRGEEELGERALALEPAVPTWSLEIPRQRFKAELSAGLGAHYANRTRGVFADNVEKAIQYLQGALTTWTREADTQDWAMAHNNLGIDIGSASEVSAPIIRKRQLRTSRRRRPSFRMTPPLTYGANCRTTSPLSTGAVSRATGRRTWRTRLRVSKRR